MTKASATDEEAADDIVRRGRTARVELSRDQLERWHSAGALRHPRQTPLGANGGSVTLYPPGTTEQAIAIARGLTKTRRLDEVAFGLWLSDSPIAVTLVRRYLVRVARWHDRLTSQIHDAGFGSAELPEEALDLIESVARKHAPNGPVGDVWDRLSQRGERETFLRILLDATAGRYVPTPSPDVSTYRRESEGLLVERAVGIANGRTEPFLGIGPWLSGNPEDTLEVIPKLMAGEWLADLREASDEDLLRARTEARDFREVVVGMGEVFAKVFGPDAFGLTAIAGMLREATSFNCAFLLIAFLRVRKLPEVSDKVQVLLAALPDVRNLELLGEQIPDLRSRPDIGDLFAPEELRAAFADEASLERHIHAVEARVTRSETLSRASAVESRD